MTKNSLMIDLKIFHPLKAKHARRRKTNSGDMPVPTKMGHRHKIKI